MNKCCLCDRELTDMFPADGGFQPFDGGTIQLVFCYGSRFDQIPAAVFTGHICDDCAGPITEKLEEHVCD